MNPKGYGYHTQHYQISSHILKSLSVVPCLAGTGSH